MKVLVLGAGLMGAQIGCEYWLGGHEVTFLTRDRTAALKRIRNCLSIARRLGLTSEATEVRQIEVVNPEKLEQPAIDLVVESLPEEIDVKLAVLAPIAMQFPHAVIASNTSSLSLTSIGDEIGAAERTIGTHYWNPPLLMPLVEVVVTARTKREVADFMISTLDALGKRPVLVEADVPGFIWNRLQLAVMREALWLADQGIASPETIDLIVREGLARRWRHVGPFASAALGGVDTWRRIGLNIVPELSRARDLNGLERWLTTDAGELEILQAQRDEALSKEFLARD